MSTTIVHSSCDNTSPARITISGRVLVQNGNPAVGVMVNARERGLRGGNVLASAQTGRFGEYSVAFDVAKLTIAAGGRSGVQLEVTAAAPPTPPRVRGKRAKATAAAPPTVLGSSQVLFNLRETNCVDIMLAHAEYTGATEYDSLVGNVRGLLGTLDITALSQDEKVQDYDFLAGTLGRTSVEIRMLADAARFSAQTSISAAVFYAVMKLGGHTSLHAILSYDRAALRVLLDKAVAQKIIAADAVGPFTALAAQFDQRVVQNVLSEQPTGLPATLATILGLAISEPKLIEQFLTSYQSWDKDLAGFWKQMAVQGKPLPAATLVKAQHAIQLGGVTGYHPQMTKALLDILGTTAAPTLRDLARWDENDWTAFVKQVGQKNQIVAVPPVIPGDGDSARIGNYAKTLARVLADAFPTAALAGRLAKDTQPPFKAPGDVGTFLNNNPTFDFAQHPVYSLVAKDSPFKLAGVQNPAVFLNDMKSAQRLFRLTPDYAQMRALKTGGIDSAGRVVEMPMDAFVTKFGPILGGGEKARHLYKRASTAHTLSAHLYANMHPQLGVSPAGVMPGQAIQAIADPNLATMFGSLELCGCDDCQSLYSPSAYFTDILAFLQKNAMPVFNELTRRRPDLVAIELTCANTNTPLPYVDLVNERLESLLLSKLSPPVPAPLSFQTRGTAGELGANPEHIYRIPPTNSTSRSLPSAPPTTCSATPSTRRRCRSICRSRSRAPISTTSALAARR
ncbi:MAG: hypothetical protein ABJA98_02605 [Acidobacteriota bacterium]